MSLVKSPTMIPSIVTDLTGISNNMVKEARSFNEVVTEFFTFVDNKRQNA